METNGVTPDYHEKTVPWDTPGLYVIRLRLLSDPYLNFWDVSYCHGMLGGEFVNVELPFFQLPKRRVKRTIAEFAERDDVHVLKLGVLENISMLC